ncbi:MAG: glycogen synthase [Saprospiraceae bacterium]|nr:glycogen synthase [Saprospiraceae bacterium]
MHVLHVSAECYPAAKTGGLGDVVGALPKYLNDAGVDASVIIPKYSLKWFAEQEWEILFTGQVRMHIWGVPYQVQRLVNGDLGFQLYVVHIPGKFDRAGVYSDQNGYFGDSFERWICFQQAVLQWILLTQLPITHIHCHDHHTGLIPFMMRYCSIYQDLQGMPSFLTIHNGGYQGRYSWSNNYLLPYYDPYAAGMLDWENSINMLGSAIKCCWAFNTVSPSYLEEMKTSSLGLEGLLNLEWMKGSGIVNGIDTEVWDPRTDPMIGVHLKDDDFLSYKRGNKAILCERFGLDPGLPILTFIGRMVHQKGVDVLSDAIWSIVQHTKQIQFVILGSGEAIYEDPYKSLAHHHGDQVKTIIQYNEALSHQLYAGSDFLLMPSREEPCGLNQLYSMRYGTIPMVRRTGGLQDTVIDVDDWQGTGICFDQLTTGDLIHSFYRAMRLYQHKSRLYSIMQEAMTRDHSWERVAQDYIAWYKYYMGIE